MRKLPISVLIFAFIFLPIKSFAAPADIYLVGPSDLKWDHEEIEVGKKNGCTFSVNYQGEETTLAHIAVLLDGHGLTSFLVIFNRTGKDDCHFDFRVETPGKHHLEFWIAAYEGVSTDNSDNNRFSISFEVPGLMPQGPFKDLPVSASAPAQQQEESQKVAEPKVVESPKRVEKKVIPSHPSVKPAKAFVHQTKPLVKVKPAPQPESESKPKVESTSVSDVRERVLPPVIEKEAIKRLNQKVEKAGLIPAQNVILPEDMLLTLALEQDMAAENILAEKISASKTEAEKIMAAEKQKLSELQAERMRQVKVQEEKAQAETVLTDKYLGGPEPLREFVSPAPASPIQTAGELSGTGSTREPFTMETSSPGLPMPLITEAEMHQAMSNPDTKPLIDLFFPEHGAFKMAESKIRIGSPASWDMEIASSGSGSGEVEVVIADGHKKIFSRRIWVRAGETVQLPVEARFDRSGPHRLTAMINTENNVIDRNVQNNIIEETIEVR